MYVVSCCYVVLACGFVYVPYTCVHLIHVYTSTCVSFRRHEHLCGHVLTGFMSRGKIGGFRSDEDLDPPLVTCALSS